MKTQDELKGYLDTRQGLPSEYNIAVGTLIFLEDGRVILIQRGQAARDERGKLEGVGGSIEGEENLHEAIHREVREELGEEVVIEIDEMLTVLTLPGDNGEFWVSPQYLCRLISGTPRNMEPEKCERICYIKLNEIETDQLSRFQKQTMEAYCDKYGSQPYFLSK